MDSWRQESPPTPAGFQGSVRVSATLPTMHSAHHAQERELSTQEEWQNGDKPQQEGDSAREGQGRRVVARPTCKLPQLWRGHQPQGRGLVDTALGLRQENRDRVLG